MLHSTRTLLAAIGMIAFGFHSIAWSQPPATPAPAAAPAAATAQFRPLAEADVQDSLAQVKTAAAAVDQRLAAAGTTADGWKEYLAWPAFEAELQKAKPDPQVINDAYDKLRAGYEGLELKTFADLRNAIGGYLFVSGYVGSPKLESAVKSQSYDLVATLKDLAANPTTDQTRKIADRVRLLDISRQMPDLAKSARDRFAMNNFQLNIGKELLDLGVGGPIDDTAPVDDVIMGTTIHGVGRTVGTTQAVLNPDPAFATFDALLQAMNYSNSVGHNGPVCIYTTGATNLAALKRFWIDDSGIHVYPATACAQTSTQINNIVSIKGRKLVERIAWRKAGQQKGEAEAIAGQHAAGKLGARVNAQADPTVAQANERFQGKVRKPLYERRAYPRSLSFTTQADGLAISGVAGIEGQLAAPSAPPVLTQPCPLSVCVHESAVNNFAENVFIGMRLNDDMVEHTAIQLTGSVPEKLKPDANQEPFMVVFPPEQIERAQPITVSFIDNGFSVTLRGSEYYTGDRKQPGMDVTAKYKFVKSPEGYKAVRDGDLMIYGFGQKPGTKRSLKTESIYIVLQRKFGKIFTPEINLKGFHFAEGRLAAAGQFTPTEIISQNGWLAIGYARAKPAGATAANN